jgi:outer membrane lipoprotein
MKPVTTLKLSVWLAAALLLSACSQHIPPEIRQAPDNSPSVDQVRHQPDTYISQRIRWGGVILHTENKSDGSWMTIIALPLQSNGKPRESDQSPGRFIAIANEFLEPLVYSRDREITVTGTVLRTETRKVGEFAYDYPVIRIDHYYLWPARQETTDSDYLPYWWYNPYYPWRPPYYYPRHYHR